MEPIIKVDNVSMCFNLSTEKHESLKEYLLAMVQGRLQYDEFYALKDVSLDIMPGDFYVTWQGFFHRKPKFFIVLEGIVKIFKFLSTDDILLPSF